MQKNFIFFFLFFLISISQLSTQNNYEGIYLSYEDFINNKKAYTKIPNSNYKLKPHKIFNRLILEVKIGDSLFIFRKNNLFGYCDKNNIKYRFYNTLSYQIIAYSKNIIIYQRTSLEGLKHTQVVTTYFFSTPAIDLIFPLTIENLKIVFKSNNSFKEFIDIHFKYDDELLQNDDYLKLLNF